MGQESKPLSPSNQDALNTALAQDVFTMENASKAGVVAGGYAKGKAQDLAKLMKEGNVSIRILALLGGIMLVTTSALGIIGRILTLRIISAVIALYTLLLGCVVIVLEGSQGRMLPIPKMWQTKLFHYALFLRYVWGRGGLYFVAGTLQVAQWNLVEILTGLYMSAVGIAYIVVGRSTAKKLAEIRHELHSESELREMFRQADTKGSGTLNQDQFKIFIECLGLNLKQGEYLTAFSFIDADAGGEIGFEDFLRWWKDWEFDSFEDGKHAVVA